VSPADVGGPEVELAGRITLTSARDSQQQETADVDRLIAFTVHSINETHFSGSSRFKLAIIDRKRTRPSEETASNTFYFRLLSWTHWTDGPICQVQLKYTRIGA
jgi:hypothetical protein